MRGSGASEDHGDLNRLVFANEAEVHFVAFGAGIKLSAEFVHSFCQGGAIDGDDAVSGLNSCLGGGGVGSNRLDDNRVTRIAPGHGANAEIEIPGEEFEAGVGFDQDLAGLIVDPDRGAVNDEREADVAKPEEIGLGSLVVAADGELKKGDLRGRKKDATMVGGGPLALEFSAEGFEIGEDDFFDDFAIASELLFDAVTDFGAGGFLESFEGCESEGDGFGISGAEHLFEDASCADSGLDFALVGGQFDEGDGFATDKLKVAGGGFAGLVIIAFKLGEIVLDGCLELGGERRGRGSDKCREE